MNDLATRQAIAASLAAFAAKPLAEAATALFESLAYKSQKRLVLKPNTPKTFVAAFAREKPLDSHRALLADWESVDFLFQLTDEEVRASTGGSQQLLFESKGQWNGAVMESYLFFALALKRPSYTRTELSGITRAVNRLFPMPAMLLFRHGETLTLAVINRRLHKRDEAKDVLEKVTLIKDIRFANPHRAHVEILADLSFDTLHDKFASGNFVALHRAWQETLDIQALNKRFFIEIRNWFYWARLHARFPDGAKKDADNRDSEALIRLLTRMIFSWFLREKQLIPGELFNPRTVATLMSDWRTDECEKDKQGRYYKAILQNLFFATLNTPIEERKFRSVRSYQGRNKHYGDQRYFRHVDLFQKKAPVEELYKTIPFLNGGLFEMLDEIPGRGDESIAEEKRVDGFSDVPGKQPLVPDFLFFGDERPVPETSALLSNPPPFKSASCVSFFHSSSSKMTRAISVLCQIWKLNSSAPTRSWAFRVLKAGNYSNTRLSRMSAPCSTCALATSSHSVRRKRMSAVPKTSNSGRNSAILSKASAAAPLTSLPLLSPLGILTSPTALPATLTANPCLACATAST